MTRCKIDGETLRCIDSTSYKFGGSLSLIHYDFYSKSWYSSSMKKESFIFIS